MKPRFNLDFNLGCGWYPGSKFQILAISLFDKIGDEIFCTFQVAKFVLSLSMLTDARRTTHETKL